MGGEKGRVLLTAAFWSGSPPHGRGKDPFCLCQPPGGGITPAWAGKSPWTECAASAARDHPRMGGEKSAPLYVVVLNLGITPAWAGKSWLLLDSCTLWRDHPRMGGEKTSTDRPRITDIGSPPHGRGKGEGFFLRSTTSGITPAWAGKRETDPEKTRTKKDHPRMGGEKHFNIVKL